MTIKNKNMKTLEEVKKHFKYAKKVKCLKDGSILKTKDLIKKGFRVFGKSLFAFDEKENLFLLYQKKSNKLAEILEYKVKTPKKFKGLKVRLMYTDNGFTFSEAVNHYMIKDSYSMKKAIKKVTPYFEELLKLKIRDNKRILGNKFLITPTKIHILNEDNKEVVKTERTLSYVARKQKEDIEKINRALFIKKHKRVIEI